MFMYVSGLECPRMKKALYTLLLYNLCTNTDLNIEVQNGDTDPDTDADWIVLVYFRPGASLTD